MDNNQMQNDYQQNTYQPNTYQPNGYQSGGYQQGGYQQPVIPEEYQPISVWGYFGYSLLFSVPCVGFIFLLVFALGGTKNINLKNWARSYFCMILIWVIISVIFALLGGFAGVMSSMSGY